MLIIAVAAAKYVDPKVFKSHTAAVSELLTKYILPVKKGDRLNGRAWRYEHLYTPEIEKYWNEWLEVATDQNVSMLKKLTIGEGNPAEVYQQLNTFDKVHALL